MMRRERDHVEQERPSGDGLPDPPRPVETSGSGEAHHAVGDVDEGMGCLTPGQTTSAGASRSEVTTVVRMSP